MTTTGIKNGDSRRIAAQRRFNTLCGSFHKATEVELAFQRQLIRQGVDGGMPVWEYWERLADFAGEYAKQKGWVS